MLTQRPSPVQGVEMQPFQALGHAAGEGFGLLAEARARQSGVIKVGLHHGAARIHAQTGRHAARGVGRVVCLDIGAETLPLAEGVERDVGAAFEETAYGGGCVGGCVAVHGVGEIGQTQLELVERACRAAHAVLLEYRESAPQRVGLEGHDDLDAGGARGIRGWVCCGG